MYGGCLQRRTLKFGGVCGAILFAQTQVVQALLRGFERGHTLFGVKARLNLFSDTMDDNTVATIFSYMDAFDWPEEELRTHIGHKDQLQFAITSDDVVQTSAPQACSGIFSQMAVVHPTAWMLIELSKAQDIEAGYRTTSVFVLDGSLLDASDKLLKKGTHPTSISEGLQKAAAKSEKMATPMDLKDRESLLKAANSKVVSQNSAELYPIAVDAVLKVMDPTREKNDKIVKQIKNAGCNVLLIQKSILREALSDLAIHFFDKMKIMVVEDIDHDCKTLGCRPIASLDHFTAENLVAADLVQTGSSKFAKVTGINYPDKTVSIIVRGSNKFMLEETDSSIHDALCDIRCLVKRRFISAGGGAPETEVARELMLHANSLVGADAYCFKAFAEAMEIIPNTLAENARLNHIGTRSALQLKLVDMEDIHAADAKLKARLKEAEEHTRRLEDDLMEERRSFLSGDYTGKKVVKGEWKP